MSDFLINKTRVDLDRCKLHRENETLSLEPKVIHVLYYLAQHQGQVVSHQTLLDAIWTNTVVEPSALQRCIAQLRKAFNDDARQQHVIATFPKKGYSLVADVSWDLSDDSKCRPFSIQHLFQRPALAASLIAGLIVMLAGVIFLQQNPPSANVADSTTLSISADQNSLLTNPDILAAIGRPDDFPVYSPDGRFVVYPRFLSESKAHLWARDLAYGSDFLLTEEAGIYEHLSWSRDGSLLVFVDSSCAADSCLAGPCTSLKSVLMTQAETNALSVEKLIDCSPQRLLAPQWLNNREIAVIEMDADKATLQRYDLKSAEKSFLYENDEVIPYQLSFSPQTKILTITALNRSGRKELIFLDLSNGSINRNNNAALAPDNNNWYPSSSPQ